MKRAHTVVAALIAVTTTFVGRQSAAQDAVFRCALVRADQTNECLTAAAEQQLRTRPTSIATATDLFIRAGGISRAEHAIEQQWAQSAGSSSLWSAILRVARARREQRSHNDGLRWCNRWLDDAKRHAGADVLTALHTNIGHAHRALGQHDRAYEAFRLAVHVWSAEHAYTIDDDGSVIEDTPGLRGFVAPERWVSQELIDAYATIREDVDASAIEGCIATHENNLRSVRQCLRSLRPPTPGPFAGLSQRVWLSPFGAVARTPNRRVVRRTRSTLNDAAFERGNRASGEAWVGMLQIAVDELEAVTVPTFRGTDMRAFDAWSRSTSAPRFFAMRALLESRVVVFAQRAIATGVVDAELAATGLMANAFRTFEQRIREAPLPPGWRREPRP